MIYEKEYMKYRAYYFVLLYNLFVLLYDEEY